ncbi:MAG: ParB/RepB/Spo0J family partition protein [Erythrobacter sp.]|jgi:ParB family chromosome partitioning protein|nr:ParB/RepB/Spo0J family partition protein [Erythrobacter sp.]
MTKPQADPIRFSVPERSSTDRKKKLGKGLGALLGETQREEPLSRSPSFSQDEENGEGDISGSKPSLRAIAIASIDPLPGNPRQHFDETALDELAASIAARGVIQPIIVTPSPEGRFAIVAGERRWRAAQRARLHEIPAIVRQLEPREIVALALIENLQREDLNPIEEARAFQRLADEEGMTQAEIARLVEKSRSHVANLQRLLALPDSVLTQVESGALSMGHARALIGHADAEGLASRAVSEGLSVREIEALVRSDGQDKDDEQRGERNGAARHHGAASDNADIAAVERHLEEFLGLTVRIKADANPKSGSVTIRYKSLDQLDLVCQRLTGGEI